MYPKPPPPEDVFDGLLHGTSERPLLVSIQPFSPSNFKALVRVGFASYWFAPRSDAKFIDRPKTTKRPESSEAAFIDGSTNDESTAPSFNFGGSQTNNSSKSTGSSLFGGNQTQSSSNATENQKMLRLRCTNKNCKAKLVLYCSNTDKYDSMFFQQNFEVSENRDSELHKRSCNVPDAWESLASVFINYYNLINRAKTVKMSQKDVRKSVIKMLNMSATRAASILTERKMATLCKLACEYEKKLNMKKPVDQEARIPAHLEYLSGNI